MDFDRDGWRRRGDSQLLAEVNRTVPKFEFCPPTGTAASRQRRMRDRRFHSSRFAAGTYDAMQADQIEME